MLKTYSGLLNFDNSSGGKTLLETGRFCIGVSCLLAAVLEYGLSEQNERPIWPPAIAPYHICVACLAEKDQADPTLQLRCNWKIGST